MAATNFDAVVAPGGFQGPLTGNVTGNVIGNVTGNVIGNVTGNVIGNVTGDLTGNVKPPTQVISVAGPTAITLKTGMVLLARSGAAAAATLAAPVAGTDDGKILTIIATTAAAHTVTIANGLSGVGASADVGTFGGAIADRVVLQAYNGAWYPIVNVNVTWA